ncbi:specifically androgen-regulated gene protein isoform X2 [Cygnus olor]|uniref:specifically androgen-regulated gene protein isoform X2 n=1 Tax=Cygnus olor TaxID=8869 RepID=UPI001ADE3A55|nr:specifically androgen-regulated gene protein isoform X2 [Cygnus olor]
MPGKEVGLGMAGCNSDSCDSMVSTASNHSQRSDNSYDYLSVEEKECLMFLEETIGSLDAEADSGVSTDDTDYAEPPRPRPKRDAAARDLENGAPPPGTGQQRAAEQRGGESSSSPAPAAVPSPGYYSLPRSITTANVQRANQVPDGKVAVHDVKDPAPPAPFQDDLVSREEQPRRSSLDAKWENTEESWTRAVPPRPAPEHASVPDLTLPPHQEMGRESTALPQGQLEQPAPQEAPQDPEAKRGPPTAPKPRKLPPNIILKTSKNSPVLLATEPGQKVKIPPPAPAGSQPGSASDAAAEKVNSGQLDPKEREKARREALEKLGLPQDHGEPRTRQGPAPAPRGEHRATESAAPGAWAMHFKSNTLERSGVGLGSCMASAKEPATKGSSSLGKMSFIERLAPSFLRSSRPRPASLGAGKDFAALKEPPEPEKSSKRRSHPLQSFPRPPRSCVSVKISPKGATDEHRREALRKLGLLKE